MIASQRLHLGTNSKRDFAAHVCVDLVEHQQRDCVLRSQRRHPTTAWDQGALRGLVAGVVAAVVVGLLAAVSGGAVGPGRMADVGPETAQVLVHAIVALGGGGLLGGLLATWRRRRSQRAAG